MDLHQIFIVILVHITLVFSHNSDPNAEAKEAKLLTEKAYAKLFKERRKEGKDLLQIIRNEGAYERKYKLLDSAYEKLLDIFEQTQSILLSSKYDPLVDKFPIQDSRLLDAVTVTLENTCLFGELLLHNPDISYRVLESRQIGSSWKDLINWGIKYTRLFKDRIVDAKSMVLLWLVDQEINPEKRTNDFTNPYRNTIEQQQQDSTEKKKTKKKVKKLPKGPRLVVRDEF